MTFVLWIISLLLAFCGGMLVMFFAGGGVDEWVLLWRDRQWARQHSVDARSRKN